MVGLLTGTFHDLIKRIVKMDSHNHDLFSVSITYEKKYYKFTGCYPWH